MKKLITTLVLPLIVAAGCHSAPPATSSAPVMSGNETGAADPAAAIRGFMDAAKQQDLQAMGALWGGQDGPARDRMDRAEVEQREFIMMCYLKHDRYDIVGDAPNPGGARAYAVSLTLGPLTRSTSFQVVQGPGGRWYVKDVDIVKLQEFCARRG